MTLEKVRQKDVQSVPNKVLKNRKLQAFFFFKRKAIDESV